VLDKYQEQSNLLDPALERMLGIALGRAREIVLAFHDAATQPAATAAAAAAAMPGPDAAQLAALMGFVYTLCRLRGHKTVTRFFPHEAADLEPVLCTLKAQDRGDHERWQTRYGLLLWLSMLVLVPFDICSIDSGLADAPSQSQRPQQQATATLVGTLCELAKAYLEDPGPTREAAAACLASLLKRPDMEVRGRGRGHVGVVACIGLVGGWVVSDTLSPLAFSSTHKRTGRAVVRLSGLERGRAGRLLRSHEQ
jgi:tubulin-specific chaperone D